MTAYTIPPAGLTPASFFSPTVHEAAVIPRALLADDIGGDGEIQSLTSRVHPVDATIREAFRLQFGTGAAVVDAGHSFAKIRKNTADAPRRLEDEARRILQPFIDRGDISVVTLLVDVDLAPDMAAVYVRYWNLHSMTQQNIGQEPTA